MIFDFSDTIRFSGVAGIQLLCKENGYVVATWVASSTQSKDRPQIGNTGRDGERA
jgi:hypothetical protein